MDYRSKYTNVYTYISVILTQTNNIIFQNNRKSLSTASVH